MTCSRMARPVDWSSTTITVLRAEGNTLTCACAMDLPRELPVGAYARAWRQSSDARPVADDLLPGAGRETRTLMTLRSADFESAASTGSAIPAGNRDKAGNGKFYNARRMHVSEFDYALPSGLIAQHPASRRSASRLLHLDAAGGLRDLQFTDLPDLVGAGDALVLNDTRVIKARLAGRKASGGQIELFVERLLGPREALVLIRASHPPQAGSDLFIGDVAVKVVARHDDLYEVHFSEEIERTLEKHGNIPLPPYITHAPQAEDAERYQTVYAARPGAVAAPTAGLHFDQAMLERIRAQGAAIASVTLHVGFGTFQPIRVDTVEAHR